MSYAIEYARQFVRSEEGITPCWLAGDNNLTEGSGRYERRVRSWSCFGNFVGATEAEIAEWAKSMLDGSYQEHWKRHNKWVDDKGLMNWVRSGIKSAAGIEAILQINPVCGGAVWCSADVWHGFDHTVELRARINTTVDFDDWIRQYRSLVKNSSEKKAEVYPRIDFGTEKIRHPITEPDNVRIYFKRKNMYLTELSDSASRWSFNVDEALAFSYDEAVGFIQSNRFLFDASLVKAPSTEGPRAVIRITEGACAGNYVGRITPRRIHTTSKKCAYKYVSPKAAQQTLERMLKKYPSIIRAEVVVL